MNCSYFSIAIWNIVAHDHSLWRTSPASTVIISIKNAAAGMASKYLMKELQCREAVYNVTNYFREKCQRWKYNSCIMSYFLYNRIDLCAHQLTISLQLVTEVTLCELWNVRKYKIFNNSIGTEWLLFKVENDLRTEYLWYSLIRKIVIRYRIIYLIVKIRYILK